MNTWILENRRLYRTAAPREVSLWRVDLAEPTFIFPRAGAEEQLVHGQVAQSLGELKFQLGFGIVE
jgi:hypothetical protein